MGGEDLLAQGGCGCLDLEVFKARLSNLAQWEVSLHMAGSWDWMIFKVHSTPQHSVILGGKQIDTEQLLNMNVQVSYCKSSVLRL